MTTDDLDRLICHSMKVIKYTLIVVVVILCADVLLARWQLNSLRKQVGNEDFLAALDSTIKPGMRRIEVEERVRGYRTVEIEKREEGDIIGYGYWFGFIPPFSKSGVKFTGEIVVSFSTDGRVSQSSHWYN
jgi:hypothetical protein